MALSDLKGESAIEALADILEPATEIMTDQNVVNAFMAGDRLRSVKIALKEHKKAVIAILATLDGVSPDDYEVNLFTLPIKLLEIINDPEVASLFQLQGQMTTPKSSGSATENIEDGVK